MNFFKRSLFIAVSVAVVPVSASASEISREDWMDSMSIALPAIFCQPEMYFRQCFDVTQTKCEETAVSVTRICLEKNKEKIPETLQQPQDGTSWGRVIGACAGESFELVLQKDRISNQKCDDPGNWQ